MKKSELKSRLERGETLMSIFEFIPGQECEIFKAEKFKIDEEIVYIPDVSLNEIVIDEPINEDKVYSDGEVYPAAERIADTLECCYTGMDFAKLVQEYYGNAGKAEELFSSVDWQHPGSVLAAGELDEEVD